MYLVQVLAAAEHAGASSACRTTCRRRRRRGGSWRCRRCSGRSRSSCYAAAVGRVEQVLVDAHAAAGATGSCPGRTRGNTVVNFPGDPSLDRPDSCRCGSPGANPNSLRGEARRRLEAMLIEMTIKGLMVDPVTNMPIVILRDEDGQRVLPIWVGRVRGQRHRAADRERHAAAADDARPAEQPDRTICAARLEGRHHRPAGEHLLRADLPDRSAGSSWRSTRGRATRIALALRARAPIFVEDTVLDHAKSVDVAPEQADHERLQRWLESLDPDDMGNTRCRCVSLTARQPPFLEWRHVLAHRFSHR